MLTDFVTGYDHLGIPTNDMDATVKFYESLGFKLAHATVNDGAKVNFFQHGDIEVIKNKLALPGISNQIRILQHRKMAADGCIRHGEMPGDVSCRHPPGFQEIQDLPAGWI